MLVVQSELEELGRLFSFVNKAQLVEFLSPELVFNLLQSHTNIKSYFPFASLTLEVVADPEIDNNIQLLLSIITDYEVEEAMDKLQAFDEAYGFDFAKKTNHQLLIDLEFAE